LRPGQGGLSNPISLARDCNGFRQRLWGVVSAVLFRPELLQFPDQLNKGGSAALFIDILANARRVAERLHYSPQLIDPSVPRLSFFEAPILHIVESKHPEMRRSAAPCHWK
jgi:hypothetical protein